MSAVYTNAIRDARNRDPLTALPALAWLGSADASIFLDAVGIDADPLVILTSEQAKTASLNTWTGRNG